MRYSISLTLAALFLSSGVATADEKSRAIPQDPEKQEQRFRDMLVWNRRTLGEAYDKVGKKDPRWDKPAREALEAAARYLSSQLPVTKAAEVYAPARQAVEAGCDDALILYLYARTSLKPNFPGKGEAGRRYTAAANAMEASAYPPFRRATALYKAALELLAQKDLSPQTRAEAARLLDTALALLPKIIKEDEHNPDMENFWFELPHFVILGQQKISGDDEAAFNQVDQVLSRDPALKAVRLKVKGDFLIRWAWKARGNGLAGTVTEEGWKKFRERLTEARNALTEAWVIHEDGQVATLMLTVEKGIGRDRDEMEKWFERAMKADGNNKKACIAKLDWLDPKWHGTPEDMIAFGKACRDTKNWRTGITLLVADAHTRALSRLPKVDRRAYLRTPEVWKDVQEVFDEYLEHYPNNNVERSRYAAFCYMCGHYPEADHQFQILGDDLVYVFDKGWMKQARSAVAGKAGPLPTEPPK